ncbi:exosomal polycystin-1-interacting protein [Rhinophrynus dorsalis]
MLSHNSQLLLFGFLGFNIIRNLVNSQNSTLIFVRDNNIRNCSCSTDIRNCDYSLANLMCNCKTVPFQRDRTASKIIYTGDLTVWFTDTTILGQLLNFTFVRDLKLSLCGLTPLPTVYLAILGLCRLRVHAAHLNEQNLTIYNNDNVPVDNPCLLPREETAQFHISYLDTSLFNGQSLKSYSVENVASITENFPNLPYSNIISAANQSFVVTFIY